MSATDKSIVAFEHAPFRLEISEDGQAFFLVQPDGHDAGVDAVICISRAQARLIGEAICEAAEEGAGGKH